MRINDATGPLKLLIIPFFEVSHASRAQPFQIQINLHLLDWLELHLRRTRCLRGRSTRRQNSAAVRTD